MFSTKPLSKDQNESIHGSRGSESLQHYIKPLLFQCGSSKTNMQFTLIQRLRGSRLESRSRAHKSSSRSGSSSRDSSGRSQLNYQARSFYMNGEFGLIGGKMAHNTPNFSMDFSCKHMTSCFCCVIPAAWLCAAQKADSPGSNGTTEVFNRV